MSALVVNFAKAVDPAVKVVFNGAFTQAPKVSDRICNVIKAEDYITETKANVNIGMAELKAEQESLKYQDFLEGDSKNFTQYEYHVGVKISSKLMKWNKLGQVKQLVANAANAISRRKEFDVTKLLERGFATTYIHVVDGSAVVNLTGGDSLAMFASNHSTVRSSTAQANVVYDGTTTNMDLAEDALEAAETYVAPRITDESDQVIAMDLTDLFVGRSNLWQAQRLLKSTGRIGTPNNDVNLVKGRYNLHTLHYMDVAYGAYWFLQDASLNKQAAFMALYEGSPLTKDGPYVDFDTKTVKFSWSFENAAGHNNWQSFIGSQGDNT